MNPRSIYAISSSYTTIAARLIPPTPKKETEFNPRAGTVREDVKAVLLENQMKIEAISKLADQNRLEVIYPKEPEPVGSILGI